MLYSILVYIPHRNEFFLLLESFAQFSNKREPHELDTRHAARGEANKVQGGSVGVGGTRVSVRSPANEKFAHICVAGHTARCASALPNLQQCSCVHHSLCVRCSSCPPIWGRVIGHCMCCGSEQGVYAKKWP